ncbi:MAG: hypothetical protein KGR98_14395 [Verrucomicrobia bacterium]|nr:hypothetical protein [Verrucomicrobiota bacterium]
MKKSSIIVVLAAAGLLASSQGLLADDTNAAPANPVAPRAGPPGIKARGPMYERMGTVLQLTDDQKQKVRGIFMDAMRQRRAISQDQTLSADDKRARLKEIRQDMNTKMKAALTVDQYRKWQKWETARMQRMRNRMEHRNMETPSASTNSPPDGLPPKQ